MCYIDSQWEAAADPGELSLVLCDDLDLYYVSDIKGKTRLSEASYIFPPSAVIIYLFLGTNEIKGQIIPI